MELKRPMTYPFDAWLNQTVRLIGPSKFLLPSRTTRWSKIPPLKQTSSKQSMMT